MILTSRRLYFSHLEYDITRIFLCYRYSLHGPNYHAQITRIRRITDRIGKFIGWRCFAAPHPFSSTILCCRLLDVFAWSFTTYGHFAVLVFPRRSGTADGYGYSHNYYYYYLPIGILFHAGRPPTKWTSSAARVTRSPQTDGTFWRPFACSARDTCWPASITAAEYASTTNRTTARWPTRRYGCRPTVGWPSGTKSRWSPTRPLVSRAWAAWSPESPRRRRRTNGWVSKVTSWDQLTHWFINLFYVASILNT